MPNDRERSQRPMITIRIHPPPSAAMSAITARATKAQILDAYTEAQARLAAGPSWGQVAAKVKSTAETVSRETALLIRDTYNAGALFRQWVSGVVAELSRPVLKSKA